MKICVDPGHSGSFEPGACAGNVTEADITMSVAVMLKADLEAEGHEVILTRYGDIDNDGLIFRSDIANEENADIFVSLHCNSSANTEANGTEVYYLTDDGACRESREIAQSIQSHVVQAMGTRSRGTKTANFCVLRETDMPAVLVEMAFISNDIERLKLSNSFSQHDFSTSIKAGILAWYKEHSQ